MPDETSSTVVIQQPERMNLLGLILGGIIERNLEHERHRRTFQRLGGEVEVRAGGMLVTMAFDAGRLTIRRGGAERPRARVGGSLDALMQLSLGGGMVGPWLSGKLKTGGSLLLLLRMRPLLQA